jgi:ABC-type transporter Mla MlaB component
VLTEYCTLLIASMRTSACNGLHGLGAVRALDLDDIDRVDSGRFAVTKDFSRNY